MQQPACKSFLKLFAGHVRKRGGEREGGREEGAHQGMQIREEGSLGQPISVVGPVLAGRSKTPHQGLPDIFPCGGANMLKMRVFQQ